MPFGREYDLAAESPDISNFSKERDLRFVTKTSTGFAMDVEGQIQYVSSVKDRLPPGVKEFVLNGWYFDQRDHRCPHDSWLENLTLSEPSSGLRNQIRTLALTVRLLGAYHDGHIELSYSKVKSYTLNGSGLHDLTEAAHGDWISDEVLLLADGSVEHEILFDSGTAWKIVSEDIIYRWLPFEVAKRESPVK